MTSLPHGRVRRYRRAVALAGLAFLISVGVIVTTPGYVPRGDSADYAHYGESIARGDGYPDAGFGFWHPRGHSPTAYRPPLYPFVLAGAFAVSGISKTAGRVATAAFGALTVAVIFLVAMEIWGISIATIAAMLAAVFPPFIALSIAFFSETLFVFLELTALLGVLKFSHARERRWLIVAGGAAGLAALTRTNGVIVVGLAALGVACVSRSWRGVMVSAGTVAVVAALVVSPWTVRNAVEFHRFVPVSTETGFTVIQVFNIRSFHHDAAERDDAPEIKPIIRNQTNEAQVDADLRDQALAFMFDHPIYALKAVAINTARTLGVANGKLAGAFSYQGNGLRLNSPFRQMVIWAIYPIYALALIGILVLGRSRTWRRPPLVFWLLPAALALSSGFAAGAARYRAPVDPFSICLAAVGLLAVSQLGRGWRDRRLRHGDR